MTNSAEYIAESIERLGLLMDQFYGVFQQVIDRVKKG